MSLSNHLSSSKAPSKDDLVFNLFSHAVRLRASDIHVRVNTKPAFRVDGKLFTLQEEQVTTKEVVKKTVDKILNKIQKKQYDSMHQADTACHYPNLGTIRINVYGNRGSQALAMRLIRRDIPKYSELGLPNVTEKFADLQRGLVLISGATSSGKSTTLAAILGDINNRHKKHVITIEDPIEYIFEDNRSVFSQRDIGIDATDYTSAIVGAMRQDPDVIMLSDLRDNETIDNALLASETGHLVLGTTHAPTAYDTVTRIIAQFSGEKQSIIRIKMAQNLKAVMAQRLLPTKDGVGRVLAFEYMVVGSRIREIIMDPKKTGELSQVFDEDNIIKGVMSFDRYIAMLHNKNRITQEVALEHASSRSDMKLRLAGIKT